MSFFKKKKMIHVFFCFHLRQIFFFLWQMIRGLRISDQCLRKREPGARDKKYSLWYKNVNPWHPLTFSAFVEWSLPEKNNSLQKKKAKLIPSSVSCFSVLRGSTMKRFASTSVSPTFAGCWRDSSRWQRRGQTSKQRYGAEKSHSDTYLGCANGKSPGEEVHFPVDDWISPETMTSWRPHKQHLVVSRG